jgi:fructose-1,6-bisphosphatase/inositol monophosphatase family enzyme
MFCMIGEEWGYSCDFMNNLECLVLCDDHIRWSRDVAAGALILEEAGGHVFDPSGSEFDMMSHRVAASSKHLKQALVEGLEGFV